MKIRKLTVLLLAACLMTESAYAQISANLDTASDSITVSGTVSEDEVQVVLLKPDKAAEDAEAAVASDDKTKLETVVEYFGQVSATDKNIETVIPMDADAVKGKYVLIVGDETSSVYFAHLSERLGDMLTEAKTALENNTFANFVADNGRYFCDSNLYDSLNSTANVIKYATDIMSKNKNLGDSELMQKLSAAMNTGIIMEALNEGKISDFSAIKSMTDDSEMKISFGNVDLIADDKIKDVISAVSGKNFASPDDYFKQLSDSIFMNVLYNGDNMSNADKKAFFEANAANLGLNLSNYVGLTDNKKAEVIAKLSALGSTTLTALQTEFDTICKGVATVTTQIGGGGGGGGSTGGVSVGGSDIRAGSAIENIVKSVLSDLSQCEWARPAIEYLVGISMISGYEDNTYKPLKNISRAEFTSIIARKYLPKSTYSGSFSDVASGSWYADYVESAFTNGIISGKGSNSFVPGENISRQDMAVILVRLARFLGHELSASDAKFADDADIAEYAKDAVYSLRSLGIINGDENGRFNPNAAATRAEAAQMIYGFIKILE